MKNYEAIFEKIFTESFKNGGFELFLKTSLFISNQIKEAKITSQK